MCLAVAATAGLLSWLIRRWWRWRGRREAEGSTTTHAKLEGVDSWVRVDHIQLLSLAKSVLLSIGCDESTAESVAGHLVESNLQSVDSHGVVRLLQYVQQAGTSDLTPGNYNRD